MTLSSFATLIGLHRKRKFNFKYEQKKNTLRTDLLGALYVLKMNCGPIHNRRWGPACVMISTWDNHWSSPFAAAGVSTLFSIELLSLFPLLSVNVCSEETFNETTSRSLSSQFSAGNGDSISMDPSRRCRFHWARGSTSSSIAVSSQMRSFGMAGMM